MSHYSQMSKLATICAISTTVPSSFALTIALDAASTLGMFARDNTNSDTCGGNTNLSPCGGTLPSDFCCPSGQTCLPLNNNTAAICCPTGQTCNVIEPISCDISLQNATLHPASTLHSAELTSQLPSCGSNQCCPLGYNCQDNGCWMNKQNANPSSTSAAPPPSASSTGSVAHPSGTSAAGDTSSSSAPTPIQRSISPGGAAAAAFFPALLLGIALTFLGLFLYRKRREKLAGRPRELRHSDSLSQTARNVSDPIYDPRFGNRTDFLASAHSASDYAAEMSAANPYAGHSASQPASGGARSDFSFERSPPPKTPGTSTSERVRSIFARYSPRLSSPLSPPSAYTRAPAPSGPSMAQQRRGSGETIDVLMPPQPSYGNNVEHGNGGGGGGGGYSLAPPPARRGEMARNTTFESMMEQAGLKRSDLTGNESQPSSGGSNGSARAPAGSPSRRYL